MLKIYIFEIINASLITRFHRVSLRERFRGLKVCLTLKKFV
jgi:hypothetical protein